MEFILSKEPLRPEEIHQLETMQDCIEDERYYKLFGIASTANQDDIQTAYYKSRDNGIQIDFSTRPR